MKSRSNIQKPAEGSTLMVVLLLVGVAVLVVGSYMAMMVQRNQMAMRSQCWNAAMGVAEAGIEEGLAQIEYSMPPTNGWTLVNGVYTKTRANPFGTADSYYTANILNTNPPIITVTGYVQAPLLSTYIKRTVQVATMKGTNQYPFGLKAKGTIVISGSSQLDSFDSSDPNYSTNGHYTPLRHKDNCYVVSQAGAAKTIQVGTGKIFGYVETAAGSGTVTFGSSGVVGDNNYASNSLNAGTVQMSPVALT